MKGSVIRSGLPALFISFICINSEVRVQPEFRKPAATRWLGAQAPSWTLRSPHPGLQGPKWTEGDREGLTGGTALSSHRLSGPGLAEHSPVPKQSLCPLVVLALLARHPPHRLVAQTSPWPRPGPAPPPPTPPLLLHLRAALCPALTLPALLGPGLRPPRRARTRGHRGASCARPSPEPALDLIDLL